MGHLAVMAYRRSTSQHRDRWHRHQTLAAGIAGLMLLWVMVGLIFLLADWQVPAQHLPWRPLSLADPVGIATRTKVRGLSGRACRTVLARGGVAFNPMPDRDAGGFCQVRDAGVLVGGSAPLRPAAPQMTCRQTLAFSLWERQVVQPLAFSLLDSGVVRIEHYGAYACRRQYGAAEGPVSAHATAEALDIAAFVLADGRRVSVLDHWNDPGEAGAFLHAVRDGACGLFEVTLSPDYNAAHRDHLHLDMSQGPFCR